MAIYHANTKAISRSKGHSSTANAAYIGGKEIKDLRTGEIINYSRKGGVLENEIILPTGIEINNLTSQQLWNKAEQSENRKDARVGREWEISLPHELSQEQRSSLAKELTQQIANRYGVACEYAIHHPNREGSDERNHHVHILTTTRKIDKDLNLTDKADIELDRKQCAEKKISTSQEQITEIRESIAQTINKHLELANCRERVSHLSLMEQGIEREPTTHKGKALAEQERRSLIQTVTIENQIAHDGNELAKINAELAQLQNIDRLEEEKARKIKEQQSKAQYYFKTPGIQVDLNKLFYFARENKDFFSRDAEKQCYSNKDKSIEVYQDLVSIKVPTENNIAKGLQLARVQFGNVLEIHGSNEFKAKAIKILSSNVDFKDISLKIPEQQVMLDNFRLEQQVKPTARDLARQALAELTKNPIPEPAKERENINAETKLSARERVRQQLANTELRTAKEVVNEYNQQKAQEQEKQQSQVKVKEHGHSRGGGWDRGI
jgi:hypothetical protein